MQMIRYLLTLLLCMQIMAQTPITFPEVDKPEQWEFWVQIPCTRVSPITIRATTRKQMGVYPVKMDHVAVYGKTYPNALQWSSVPEPVELQRDNSVAIIEPHKYSLQQSRILYRFIVITHSYPKTVVTLSLSCGKDLVGFEYLKIRKRGVAFDGASALYISPKTESAGNHQAPPPTTSKGSMGERKSSKKRQATWPASSVSSMEEPESSRHDRTSEITTNVGYAGTSHRYDNRGPQPSSDEQGPPAASSKDSMKEAESLRNQQATWPGSMEDLSNFLMAD